MKINGNEIKTGNVIKHKNSLWVVTKVGHVKPGKGGAFAQAEMKNLLDRSKLNERFRASETVEKVRLEQRQFQFLYRDADKINLMDSKSFEQIELNASFVDKNQIDFLQENMLVNISIYEDKPINMQLPDQVTLQVKLTDPSLKGQTVTSSYKPAVLENDVKIMVPPFINNGDRITINPMNAEYLKKAE